MAQYVAPLRDMQFVLHELLDAERELKQLSGYEEIDAGTINQVLEEGGGEATSPIACAADSCSASASTSR